MRSLMYFSGYLFLQQLLQTICQSTTTVSHSLSCFPCRGVNQCDTHPTTAMAVVSAQSQAEVWRAVHAHHHLGDRNQCRSSVSNREASMISGLQQHNRMMVTGPHVSVHVIDLLFEPNATLFLCVFNKMNYVTCLMVDVVHLDELTRQNQLTRWLVSFVDSLGQKTPLDQTVLHSNMLQQDDNIPLQHNQSTTA